MRYTLFCFCGILLFGSAPAAVAQEAEALADLRPPVLQTAEVPATAFAEGRRLLAAAVEAVGGVARWQQHETATLVYRDTWAGPFAAYAPWPVPDQTLQQALLLGTFTSQVTFLDGEQAGAQWGIQAWATYHAAPEAAPQFADDPRIALALPTTQYLLELPFRLLHAPLAAAAGTATWQGRSYDRVLVTWESLEPHAAYDQFLLWINQQTGRIDVVQFTVREAGGSATTVMLLDDYRAVQGIWWPFQQTFRLGLDSGPVLHTVQVQSLLFDAVPRQALLPDPARTNVGDRKPAHR